MKELIKNLWRKLNMKERLFFTFILLLLIGLPTACIIWDHEGRYINDNPLEEALEDLLEEETGYKVDLSP